MLKLEANSYFDGESFKQFYDKNSAICFVETVQNDGKTTFECSCALSLKDFAANFLISQTGDGAQVRHPGADEQDACLQHRQESRQAQENRHSDKIS